MQYKRIVRHFAAFRRAIAHINAQRPAKNDVAKEEPALAAVDVRSSTPGCPDGPPAMSISQRIGTIYPGAPGATGRQACARSFAEHATPNTTKEANDRCRTPDDSTAEDKHSGHNRTNLAPRQAPASSAPPSFSSASSLTSSPGTPGTSALPSARCRSLICDFSGFEGGPTYSR